MADCFDCLRPYGHEHGFPDLVIPDWAWLKISPRGNEGGLLCPSCICKRLDEQKIQCEGAFMSGPIISVSQQIMWLISRVYNLEIEQLRSTNEKEPSMKQGHELLPAEAGGA